MNYDQKHAESVKQLSGFYRIHYYVNLLQLKTDAIVFYILQTLHKVHKMILRKFVLAEFEKGSENWCLGLIFIGLALVFFGKSNGKKYPTLSYLKPF